MWLYLSIYSNRYDRSLFLFINVTELLLIEKKLKMSFIFIIWIHSNQSHSYGRSTSATLNIIYWLRWLWLKTLIFISFMWGGLFSIQLLIMLCFYQMKKMWNARQNIETFSTTISLVFSFAISINSAFHISNHAHYFFLLNQIRKIFSEFTFTLFLYL